MGKPRDSLHPDKEKRQSKRKPSSQNIKTSFRATKTWQSFRERLKKERRNDELTLRPLRKGWNLHHMDLDENHYKDISDESHFCVFNKKSHDTIHFLYTYYEKDPEILDRLEGILERMREINSSNNPSNT